MKLEFGVVAMIIAVAIAVTVTLCAAPPCESNSCYGGLCMTSAACAEGCHCFGGRCG